MSEQLSSENSSFHTSSLASYGALGVAFLLSALGWYAVGKWMQPTDKVTQFVLALLRTIFTLLPALAGFWVANRRNNETQEAMAQDLDKLREMMDDYQRLLSVDHELRTMTSLSNVARSSIVSTATSAKSLYGAIVEIPHDGPAKTILLERFRTHSNSVMTTLTAVQEQMNVSGTTIAEILTSHEHLGIVQRKTRNAEEGIKLAREMVEARGIGDSMSLISSTLEQAQSLQDKLSSAFRDLKTTEAIEGVN